MFVEIPFGLKGKIFRSVMPFSTYDNSRQVLALYIKNRIDIVVLLVEQQEYFHHSQIDLKDLYRSKGMEVIHSPIKDFGIPENKEVFNLSIDFVLSKAKEGKNVAVHCVAGLGRTGMFLACLARKRFGYSGQEAIHWIRGLIPGAVENPNQEAFVIAFQ